MSKYHYAVLVLAAFLLAFIAPARAQAQVGFGLTITGNSDRTMTIVVSLKYVQEIQNGQKVTGLQWKVYLDRGDVTDLKCSTKLPGKSLECKKSDKDKDLSFLLKGNTDPLPEGEIATITVKIPQDVDEPQLRFGSIQVNP